MPGPSETGRRLVRAVRRGARIDLIPLEAALREAGIRCELRHSAS